ncbi:MAG: ABC transporter permease [Treponema sp.]|jgi:ABC-2 type transport system permease protein|nr:ABC transporter permease [Treponema sp.]
MKQLLAAEWYKLTSGKLIFIILAGAAIQTFLGIQRTPEDGETLVLVMEALALFNKISWVFCFWLLAFAAFFIAQEFSHGTIRNTLAIGKKRTSVYLAKLIVLCVVTIPLLAVLCIAVIAGCTWAVGFGDASLPDFIKSCAAQFFIQLVFHLCYAPLFAMIIVVCRNPALTIMVGFAYILSNGMVQAFLSGLPEPLSFLKTLSLEYYINNLKDPIGSAGTDITFILQGFAASLCYFTLYTSVGCLLFKKMDIK